MKLASVQAMTREAIAQYTTRNDYIKKFDDILCGNWSIPADVKAVIPGLSAVVSSDPSDYIDAAIRKFTVLIPSLRVTPNNTSIPERERVNDIENILRYHFRRANQRGGSRPLEEILRSCLAHGGTAFQVRYLPYDNKGKSGAKYRAMRRRGDFVYNVHPLNTVYPRFSSKMLENVVLVKTMTAADAIREYENMDDGRWIERFKEKIGDSDPKEAQANLEKRKVTVHDYTDYDERIVWISMQENDTTGGGEITVTNKKHNLPFLPWVYEEMSKPMLKTVVDFKSWEDKNLIDSLRLYDAVAMIARPRYWMKTISGEAKSINYTQIDGTVGLQVGGEDMGALPAPQIDPAGEIQSREASQKMGQQIASSSLTNLPDSAPTAPFSTINALIQLGEESITLAKQTAEASLEDAFYQELEWIHFSGETLVGRRLQNRKNSETGMMGGYGANIQLSKDDFDPANTYLCVGLRANTPTDKQARLNMALNLTQGPFKVATQDALEAYGLDDIIMDEAAWYEEQYETAELANDIKRAANEVQLEFERKSLEQQMAAQPGTQQMTPENANQARVVQGQMVGNQGSLSAPAAGGGPPQAGAPAMTREAVTGQAVNGREIT